MVALIDEPAALLRGGLKFRGFVRYDDKREVVNLTLTPVGPRQVLIKTEAAQACYTFANWILGDEFVKEAYVPGHGGVGRVVAVGDQVRRLRVGDRALVGITPNCGVCFHCLQGRGDMCNFINSDDVNGHNLPPFATMDDGRIVTGGRGGYSEYMVVNEEWCAPIFTDFDAAALSLMSCVGAAGLTPATIAVPVTPGEDAVVFGCGPVGMSAVNGAAMMNAAQVIAIDPIAYRREMALEVGATTVIDPTGKDDTLVEELKEMCKGPTDRFWAGGRAWYGQVITALNPGPPTRNARGPGWVFEGVGGQRMVPAVEPSPDPTGILSLKQAYECCPSYGRLVTTAVGQKGELSFNPNDFCNKGRTHYQAQYGRTNLMRDAPKFVSMMERGQYHGEKIASSRHPLEDAVKTFEEAALRTTVSSHVVFPD